MPEAMYRHSHDEIEHRIAWDATASLYLEHFRTYVLVD